MTWSRWQGKRCSYAPSIWAAASPWRPRPCPHNPTPIALHEGLGFTHGARIHRAVDDGAFHRRLVYGMTAEECGERVAPLLEGRLKPTEPAMPAKIVPILRYADAARAIAWLGSAFGFEPKLVVPGENGRIEHARLVLGECMVMLASLGRTGAFEASFRTPQESGFITQAISIHVEDPDAIYATACAAAAEIVDEIADFEFGGRMFTCRDIEGHTWNFGSHDPWAPLPEH